MSDYKIMNGGGSADFATGPQFFFKVTKKIPYLRKAREFFTPG